MLFMFSVLGDVFLLCVVTVSCCFVLGSCFVVLCVFCFLFDDLLVLVCWCDVVVCFLKHVLCGGCLCCVFFVIRGCVFWWYVMCLLLVALVTGSLFVFLFLCAV